MAIIAAYARYEDADGDGVDGIAVTWDIDRVVRATGVRNALVTGGATNIVFGRRGLYGYRLEDADLTTYDYLFTAITADATPTGHEIAAVQTLWSLQWYDVATAIMTTAGSIGLFLVGLVTSISAILCNVWSCARRTLTMPITHVKSMLLGTKLEILRGDTFDQDITGLGDLTTATELWFTVKKQLSDADTAAEIQISLTGGLLAIAGGVATAPANGSITVVDAATGHITVYLEAEEAAKLDVDFVGYWDIQKAVGDVVTTLPRGNCQVLGDSTRSVA
jgi:hypothetical protein